MGVLPVFYVSLVQKRALNPTKLELWMLGATVRTLVLCKDSKCSRLPNSPDLILV